MDMTHMYICNERSQCYIQRILYLLHLLLVLGLLCRFACMTSPLLSLLGLFFRLFCYHPIQHHLSSSSSSFLSFHFPSRTVLGKSPLSMCPIRFPYLFLNVCIRALSFQIPASTS